MKKLTLSILTSTLLFANVGTLTKIVDGDTVDMKQGSKIIRCRLAYIDTPESKKNLRAKEKSKSCNIDINKMVNTGKLSSQYLSHHLKLNQKYNFYMIDYDERYKRAVCEIYKGDELINLKIVLDGYAVPYYSYIKEKQLRDKFKNTLNQSKNNFYGLWKNNQDVMDCLAYQKKSNSSTSTSDFSIEKILSYVDKFLSILKKLDISL